MLRSVAAVLSGVAVYSLAATLLLWITERPPEMGPGRAFGVFAILYGAFFAAVAGFIAASMAPRARLAHASVVAGVLLITTLGSAIFVQRTNASPWWLVEAIVIDVPAVIVGGVLRHRRHRRTLSAMP